VSRIPRREALLPLQREGPVLAEVNRCIRIADLPIADVEERYPMRIALGAVAIRITVPTLTGEDLAELEGLMAQMDHCLRRNDLEHMDVSHRAFHARFVGGAGRRVTATIGQLFDHAQRYRRANGAGVRMGGRCAGGALGRARRPRGRRRPDRGADGVHHARMAGHALTRLDPGHDPAPLRAAVAIVVPNAAEAVELLPGQAPGVRVMSRLPRRWAGRATGTGCGRRTPALRPGNRDDRRRWMSAVTKPSVTREELLRRASELVPVLAERALETERLRRIPDQTIDDLRRRGLLRIANPERYGGYGLDYDTVLEVGLELGRGDGSVAWNYTVWSSHNWLLGLYPERAQEEYFASPDVLSSSAFNPARGRAEKAEGGWTLSGRWDFSSGCDAGQWALLAAFTPEQGPGLFLVPRRDYEIHDTWFVSGLCGTGSKDIVMEPTFVPGHRFLSYEAMGSVRTPGKDLHPRATYRLPVYSLLPFTLAVPLLGIAQGAIDHFERRTRERITAFTGARMATLLPLQVRLAEATAEVDCARLLMQHDLQELLQRGARGEEIPMVDRLRYRRDHAYIARLAVRAVNRLFEVSGGGALYRDSPLQRAHRDVHAGSKQIALIWDTYAEQYGRVRLGLEPTDAII